MNLLMAWMPPPDGIKRARRDDTSPRSAHKRTDDHHLTVEELKGLLARIPQMGRQKQLSRLDQVRVNDPIALGERLDVKDIKRCAGQLSLTQAVKYVRGVHDGAARCIDQRRVRSHRSQLK